MPPRKLSRYTFSSGVKDDDGVLFLTDPIPFSYQDLSDNRYHEVAEGDSLFSLAGRYFRRSFPRPAGLWWVIGHFQPEPIHDPTIRLEPGSVIIIPSDLTVEQRVFAERRRRETEVV